MKLASSYFTVAFRHSVSGEIHTVVDTNSAHPDEACDRGRRMLAAALGYDIYGKDGEVARCFDDWCFVRATEVYADGREQVAVIDADEIVRAVVS
jgi:hypothetical protein